MTMTISKLPSAVLLASFTALVSVAALPAAVGLSASGTAAVTPTASAVTRAGPAAGADDEFVMKSGDQAKLAKAVENYFAVKLGEKKGLLDSLEKIDDELAKLEKKYNKKGKGTPIPSLVRDLQRVFLMATDRPGKEAGKAKGRIAEFDFTGHFGDEIEYVVHAPKKYNASKLEKSGGLPVVLIIPDLGEDLRDHLDLHWTNSELRASTILVAVGMPENISMWHETGAQGKPGGRGSLLQVFRRISDSFVVDTDRVFLAGHGAGVAAVVKIANGSPSTYAGVIGRAGDMDETAPTNFLNVPTYFVGGAKNVTAFADAAKALEMDNVTVAPEGLIEDITAWLALQKRDLYPERIVFAPATQRLKRSYWLNLMAFEPDDETRIEAVLERDTNTARITATGVSSVVLEFNDLMLDLDKPVTVICNGVSQDVSFTRSFRTAMDQVFKSADPSRVVVASKRFDVPLE